MNVSETIDSTLLMEAACDDQDLAIELIHLYFDLTDKELDRLEDAAGNGDAATVSAVAHKCAGSSVACGMTALGVLLRTLELDAKQGLPDDLSDQLKKIREEMASVRDALNKHFQCNF